MSVMDLGCPRLLEGIALIPVGDAWLVEGGIQRDVFTGRVPAVLFGALLPLLDGRHTVDDIATILGVRTDLIAGIVERFRQRGLLSAAEAPSSSDEVFLTRSLSSGRATVVRRKLAHATVTVHGEGELAMTIAGLLTQSGMGKVLQSETCPRDLAVDLTTNFHEELVLPVRVLTDRVVVGPITDRRTAAARLASPVGPTSPVGSGSVGSAGLASLGARRLEAAVIATVAGVVGRVVTSVLGGLGGDESRRSFWEVDLANAVPVRATVPSAVQSRGAGESPWSGEANPRRDVELPAVRRHLTEPRLSFAEVDQATRIAASIAWYATSPGAASVAGATRAEVIRADGSRWAVEDRELIRVGQTEPGPLRIELTGDLSATTDLFGDEAPRVLWHDLGLALAQADEYARSRGWQVDQLAGSDGRFHEAGVTVVLSADGLRRRLRGPRRQTYRFDGAPVRAGDVRGLVARSGVRAVAYAGELPPAVGEYLEDRELCAPGLVLVLGPTEPERLCAAARAVREMQVVAAGSGLDSGIFARLPATLLSAAPGDQVLAGLAIGRPATDVWRAERPAVVVW